MRRKTLAGRDTGGVSDGPVREAARTVFRTLRFSGLPPGAGGNAVPKKRNTPGLPGAAAPYVPSGSDDMCVRTDENPEGFVLCGFCRPERMREAKPVKARKSGVQPLFRHYEAACRFFSYAAGPRFFRSPAFLKRLSAGLNPPGRLRRSFAWRAAFAKSRLHPQRQGRQRPSSDRG